MRKNHKRLWAFIISLILVATTLSSDLGSARVHATGEEVLEENTDIVSLENNGEIIEENLPTEEEPSYEEPEEAEEIQEEPVDDNSYEEEQPSEDFSEEAPEESVEENADNGDEAVFENDNSENIPTEETEVNNDETPADSEEQAGTDNSQDTGADTAADDQAADELPEEAASEAAPEEPAEEAVAVPEAEEAQDPEEQQMPAVTFNMSAGGVNVAIDAPEGAFPEGTTVTVTPVYDSGVIAAVKDTVEQEVNSDTSDSVKTVEKVIAVDITFYCDGEEIEPAKAISVKMTSSELAKAEDAQVVHVDDSGDTSIVGATVSGNAAEFESDTFSIYALVTVKEEDEEFFTRTYFFRDINEEDSYVPYFFTNEAGQKVDNQILRNIEGGNVLAAIDTPYHAGKVFEGWFTLNDDGNPDTQVKLGEAVDLTGLVANEEVTLVAVYKESYTVTFKDELGTVIENEVVNPENGPYTIDKQYTPYDPDKAFLGWEVVEGTESNIQNVKNPAQYENSNQITITGNVVFKAYTPKGNWLSFEGNGTGSSYTAPQFVKEGDITSEPTAPTRYGYIFDGWYQNKPENVGDHPTGDKFVFNSSISERTTLYAGWSPNLKAKYRVVVWTENLTGGTSYYGTYVRQGLVGTTIDENVIKLNDYDAVLVKDEDNNETKIEIVGFRPKEFDENVVIKTEGNAIVNVIFERITYTIKFRYAKDLGNDTYEFVHYETDARFTITDSSLVNAFPTTEKDGDYYYIPVEITYGDQFGNNWPDYDRFEALYNVMKGNSGYNSSGARNYTRMTSWILMDDAPLKTSTGGNGGNTVKGKIDTLDYQILGNWKSPEGNYLTARFDKQLYQYTYRIFFDVIDGEEPPQGKEIQQFTYTEDGKTITKNYYFVEEVSARSTSDYGGQKPPAYNGFTNVGNTHPTGEPNLKRHVSFFYNRSTNKVLYYDGVYVSGANHKEILDEYESLGLIKESDPIQVDASVASEGSFKPSSYDGFVFAGWYGDKECTGDPFDFQNATMPQGGIEVYAKWIRKEYRVFLHTNASGDTTLDWGAEGQATCFKVDYGKKVVGINQVHRADYELIGWYSDPEFKHPFNFDAYAMTEETTEPYDQTESTERDKWGDVLVETNKDANENRYWVDRKIDLYARWRGKLEGADGISLEYDVALGKDDDLQVVVDPILYKDQAKAEVLDNTAKAPDGQRFDHWVLMSPKVMRRAGDLTESDITFKPGNLLTATRDYARMQPVQDANTDTPSYQYIIRLRAVYVPDTNEDIRLTKIVYNGNGDAASPATTALVSDTAKNLTVSADKTTATYSKIQINAPITVAGNIFTRPGYEFLGWANENPDATEPDFVEGDLVGADNLPKETNTLYAIWKEVPQEEEKKEEEKKEEKVEKDPEPTKEETSTTLPDSADIEDESGEIEEEVIDETPETTESYSDDEVTVINEAPVPQAAVLGARREAPAEEEPAVLGARRGGTDDTTDNVSRIIVLLLAAAALGLILLEKRENKEEN